ncbi:MAG: 3-keto-disaccharide hydrolase [Limisphaerales bacterium]
MKKISLLTLCLLTIIAIAGCSTAGKVKNKSNETTVLFDGKTLSGWTQIPKNSWMVANGAMASLGVGRGVIYTANDYSHYRLMFTMRHISGNKDHQACILIFCTRPQAGEKPLDALGGIQFQVPNGGHWDYRKGHNNGGKGEFTPLPHPKFDVHQWSRVEILVNAKTGAARMAVAQPPGGKAVEVLDFNVPQAGKIGPIAWQMHNKGLFDEYKDVTIEVNPKDDNLITVK